MYQQLLFLSYCPMKSNKILLSLSQICTSQIQTKLYECFLPFQLLCQILNRVSSQTSSFQHVVLLDIPDLEAVDHFPILAAVVGILLALLKDDMTETASAYTNTKESL